MTKRTGVFLTVLGILCGCARAPVRSARRGNATAQHRVPPGCEGDLAGAYIHASDPSYRYVASDDGGTLTVLVFREFEDAGSPSADRSATAITLQRSPSGFTGSVQAKAFLPGTSCDLGFPAEVKSCDDAGMVIASPSRMLIDDQCQPGKPGFAAGDAGETQESLNLHRLVRLPSSGTTRSP